MKEIKLVLVGDGCVGKTALWVAYAENRVLNEQVPTIFNKHEKVVKFAGEKYRLNVLDTGGSEDYDQIRLRSYLDTDVFVVVFSVGEPESYENVTEKWIPEVKRHMPNIPIVLVGNKIDLRTDPSHLEWLAKYKLKSITTEVGGKLARDINAAAYVECSFLDQKSVKNLFEKSINMLVKFPDKTPSLYIFMMGDSNVGKTALKNAYLDNRFDDHFRHSRNNYHAARSLIDGEQYIMHIWSTEKLYAFLCSAIILVFSVNDLQSYKNIPSKWIPKVKKQCPTAPVILVGNKTDLRDKENETVTTEMGNQLAREINAVAHFECSCRDGKTATIERIFETAARASYFVKVEKFLKKSNKTLFKVHLAGNASVGKKSLQNRFQIYKRFNKFNQHLNVVDQRFNERWHSDYNFAGFTEVDGEECGWIICNGLSDSKITNRDEQYLLKKDRGIDVFMLVFSVVDLDSYLSIEKKWIPKLQKLKHYNPKIPIVLVGIKTDLKGIGLQTIPTETGKWLARKIDAAKYLECSTFNGKEVESVFEETAWASIRYAEERRKPKSWFRKLLEF